ncbi:LacI family transcriptional regulator [Pseudonocardia sp. DSM 110487]|uniref:LacI family DNA-binding transcriptional regulator n=1 Tax=Pseudonocardia sp. DSM 110487 TaxID=2865833 RepID=UPI001C69444D|nr:LacI family DNA-binding transcriptional regulator [Pseudonocardia sp. DSM 110487]QYN34304.1 LacI family transcriptional regulator [Pseudonocardia sp. DSM 110487]
MVTSRDVARVAGVSQSTVSYVMSGRRTISAETRKRVLDAIEQLTYQPNAGARALASQRTHVVGLVVRFRPGADTTGLLPFIETIAGCARAADHDVLLVTADEGSAGLTRLAGRALCDAIVMMDIEADDARIPVAATLRVPVILIGVPDDSAGLHCVDVDFAEAGRLAVDELAAAGHDRIVVIGHPPDVVERDINYVRRFQRGASAAAEAHGVGMELVSPVPLDRAGVEDAVREALERGGDRPGFVIPNSPAVQPVLQAVLDRGLTPGRDISLVGLCTDAAAEATRPAVTNVSLEPRDVSRRAMEILFRLLDRSADDPAQLVELIPPRLTRRKTTLPAP